VIQCLSQVKRFSGYIEDTKNKFLNHLEVNHNNSNTLFKKFTHIEISTSRNKSISGKSFIELPLWIKNKRCCVNIKNNDDKCFKWSLLAYKNYDNIKSTSKSDSLRYTKYWDQLLNLKIANIQLN